jgi:uncharacterized protein YceH (UPF0502 family)
LEQDSRIDYLTSEADAKNEVSSEHEARIEALVAEVEKLEKKILDLNEHLGSEQGNLESLKLIIEH